MSNNSCLYSSYEPCADSGTSAGAGKGRHFHSPLSSMLSADIAFLAAAVTHTTVHCPLLGLNSAFDATSDEMCDLTVLDVFLQYDYLGAIVLCKLLGLKTPLPILHLRS